MRARACSTCTSGPRSATVRITFTVTPGPVAHIRHDPVEGHGASSRRQSYATSSASRRRPLLERRPRGRSPGAPRSRRFASVSVELDTKSGGAADVVPLTVTCEVSKLRALLLGGGLRVRLSEDDVHGLIGWQSSNFLGGLRRFEVRFKPGVVLYPTRFPDVQAPSELLFEERSTSRSGSRRSSRVARTGVVACRLQRLSRAPPGARRRSARLPRGSRDGRCRAHVLRHLYVSPQYGAQGNFPFDYIGKTPDALTLVISYFDIFSYLDLRDDPVHPRRASTSAINCRSRGSPAGRRHRRCACSPSPRLRAALEKRVVFASRASVGFLFPSTTARTPRPTSTTPGRSAPGQRARLSDRSSSEVLYAGGPSSNRGYPLRGIGPYDVIST